MRQQSSEEASRKLAEEAAALRQRLAQAEHSSRSREREAERLQRSLDGARGSEAELSVKAAEQEAAIGALQLELAAARQRAVQLEGGAKARDKEVERLQRLAEGSRQAEVRGGKGRQLGGFVCG